MTQYVIQKTAHYMAWAAAPGELIRIYVDDEQVAEALGPDPTGAQAVSIDFWTTSGDYTALETGQRLWTEPDAARLIVRRVKDGGAEYDSHPHLRANG